MSRELERLHRAMSTGYEDPVQRALDLAAFDPRSIADLLGVELIGEGEGGRPVIQCPCTKLTGLAAADCSQCGGEGMFQL